MEQRKQEFGRSMLETVAVVIIIGVLIVASLAGYSFVMKKWRTRQTVDQMSAVALGMRAGNLAQRYGKDEPIPVNQIVRGLKTKEGDKNVAILPDSEYSYLRVTSLGINKYMMQVGLTPETCVEFIEKAKRGQTTFSADIVGIAGECEGDNCRAVTQKLADIDDDKIDAACSVNLENSVTPKSKPTVALVWGCGEGGGNYFYHGDCQECPNGEAWDGNTCCAQMDPDTGKCPLECPKNTVWWAAGEKCVECFENKHCPSTTFSKHICDADDTNKCIECLEDRDCTEASENLANSQNYSQAAGWSKRVCHTDHKCYECTEDEHCPSNTVEIEGQQISWKGACLQNKRSCSPCIMNYQGNGTPEPGECPEEAPVCKNPSSANATCDKCTAPRVWSTTEKKCICPSNNPVEIDGVCCPEGSEELIDGVCCPEGTARVENGVCIPEEAPVTKVCEDWKAPENANDPCKPNTNYDTCIADSTEEPDESKHGCHQCAVNYDPSYPEGYDPNSTMPGLQAATCPEGKPVCNNRAQGGTSADYTCKKCINDKTGADRDTGCLQDGKPLCNGNQTGTNKFGDNCYKCINDHSNGENHSSTKDTGCSENAPFCETATDKGFANSCKYCVNNKEGANRDSGCKETDKPLCATTTQGAFANACHTCINDKTGTNTDSGCSDGKPLCSNIKTNGFADWCGKCVNDKTGITPDTGCNEAGKPLCGGKTNEFASYCYKCINDKSDLNRDTGCTETDKPMCANATNQGFANWCAMCINDQKGTARDKGCTKEKPMCNSTETNGFGSGCYFCQNDKTGATVDTGCTKDSPLCANATQGGFGTVCRLCINDKKASQQDTGCKDAAYPMCNNAELDHFGNACGKCQNDQTGATRDTGCTNKQPLCGNVNQGRFARACYVCINDKNDNQTDTGCSAAKPLCDANSGAFGNLCKPRCSDGCYDTKGNCIKLKDFDDLKKDSKGNCQCYDAVSTQDIKDMEECKFSGTVSSKPNWHHQIDGYSSGKHEREYKIPVRFYCARYMHVSDGMEADDYISHSYPDGVGENSPGKSGRVEDAWDNSIKPKVSKATIGGVNKNNGRDTAVIRINNIWVEDVGISSTGHFYFTRAKGGTDKGARQTLTVTAGWSSRTKVKTGDCPSTTKRYR